MRTVYKYPLGNGRSRASLPSGAQVILFGRDYNGQISLWVEENTDYPLVTRIFEVAPTGIEVQGKHVASFIDGPLVWHLYEEIEA